MRKRMLEMEENFLLSSTSEYLMWILFQPPIALFGIEGRYANALYSAAHKQKCLEKVEKDLLKFEVRFSSSSSSIRPHILKMLTIQTVSSSNIQCDSVKLSVYSICEPCSVAKAAVKSDKRLAEFLFNPLVSKPLKKQALEEGLAKQNYNALTVNLMGVMAENGRMKYAPAVVDAFSKIMSAERGEVLCEVTTAKVYSISFCSFSFSPHAHQKMLYYHGGRMRKIELFLNEWMND